MNTAAKLSAYGVALAVVAGGGWAIGTAVGPFAGSAAPTAAGSGGSVHDGEDAGTAEFTVGSRDTAPESAPAPQQSENEAHGGHGG